MAARSDRFRYKGYEIGQYPSKIVHRRPHCGRNITTKDTRVSSLVRGRVGPIPSQAENILKIADRCLKSSSQLLFVMHTTTMQWQPLPDPACVEGNEQLSHWLWSFQICRENGTELAPEGGKPPRLFLGYSRPQISGRRVGGSGQSSPRNQAPLCWALCAKEGGGTLCNHLLPAQGKQLGVTSVAIPRLRRGLQGYPCSLHGPSQYVASGSASNSDSLAHLQDIHTEDPDLHCLSNYAQSYLSADGEVSRLSCLVSHVKIENRSQDIMSSL